MLALLCVPTINDVANVGPQLRAFLDSSDLAWTSSQGGGIEWYYIYTTQRERARKLVSADESFAPYVRDDVTEPYYIDVDAGFESRVRAADSRGR
ncbi:MAG: hypothetical protein KDB73_05070 [Planctomycetes bacterium]|nr:hypothetical protein [Planctomycetota bacterium]